MKTAKAITIIKVKNGFVVVEKDTVLADVSLNDLTFYGEIGSTDYDERRLTGYLRAWAKDEPETTEE